MKIQTLGRNGERFDALVVATLFPNPGDPHFGIFVRRRVEALASLARLAVMAPVPYFPLACLLKRYAHRCRIPRTSTFTGLLVSYPRFLSIPKFLKPLDGVFLFLAIAWCVVRDRLTFRVVLAEIGYPDGYGALLLARVFGKPLIVTLRGHDINVLPQHPIQRRQLQAVLRGAARVLAVADALRTEAIELGCAPDRIEVLPNGVDTTLFYPGSSTSSRCKLNLPSDKKILISVGGLVERKGVHLVIEALNILSEQGHNDLFYVVVGGRSEEGDCGETLKALVKQYGLTDRVLFVGIKPNEELREWYIAADLLCLASDREGRPNVILEALACGIPVVATNVWGTPEIITHSGLGVLVNRSGPEIAKGIAEALSNTWDSDQLITHGGSHSWEKSAELLYQIIDGLAPKGRVLQPSTVVSGHKSNSCSWLLSWVWSNWCRWRKPQEK